MSGMGTRSGAALPRWCVVGASDDGAEAVVTVDIGGDGDRAAPRTHAPREFPGFVASREVDGHAAGAPVRWVWADTAASYAALLSVGVRVERSHDLRLCRAILRTSALVTSYDSFADAPEWDRTPEVPVRASVPTAPTLFDAQPDRGRIAATALPQSLAAALSEFARQRAAIDTARDPRKLGLLLAAESAGALVAAEMTTAGLPWDTAEHGRILEEALGQRPAVGAQPEHLRELGIRVREALGDPRANIDSPPQLLRALRAAGVETNSTSQWELMEFDHPVIEPLLDYKKRSRLMTSNGWHWLDEWVHEGRYRPVYVPGGVVTGRWASSGGGALQIPRLLRPALRADPGWLLVSADVAQLEPRVLAALAGDRAMAAAGRATDLYAGMVASGAVATRQEAKIAMLGAMYGSTTGDAGRLVPRLRRTFPAAMRLVDEAARAGERGASVSTLLGRTSPAPDDAWLVEQSAASQPGASAANEGRARRAARDRGRFTRNFVVQGTAAEWALAWLADIRLRLARIPPVPHEQAAAASGLVFGRRPHLAFFLHDEVIVHTPAARADEASEAIRAAARSAGSLLFGSAPIEFPLDLTVSERAAKS